MRFQSCALALTLALASTSIGLAQKTVTQADKVTATAKVTAIDSAKRLVTIRTDAGEEDTYEIGPGVQRFNEVKVGDTVKVTYYESVVYQLRVPGQRSNAPADSVAATQMPGKLPGGTISAQQKTTVTVKAIDAAKSLITVATQDGHAVTRKVNDKKNLEGVKVGDRIDITYTQAVLASVERTK